MPLTISDEDQPTHKHGTHFRVVVFMPAFVERLIERLRCWIGARR
jgi:hypothetical protein